MDEARRVLREHFGFSELRPGQVAAIGAVLAGRDGLLVLPTGGGKSLCYQVPAVVARARGGGPTVVVSPLIALMDDQVEALRARGIPAVAIHSGHDAAQNREAWAKAGASTLIYVSPERLRDTRARALLGRLRPSLYAVDEAHCISQWGHDFRPAWRELGDLREMGPAPILAVTATATPRVRVDIAQVLGLVAPEVVVGDFRRPNLSMEVEHCTGDTPRLDRLVALLGEMGLGRGAPGRVVIYAATRKRARAVSDALRKRGFDAGYYHAGRTDGARQKAAEAFSTGKRPVLVATSAFGMGIDFPDVRLVAHVQAPGSLEAWYQEAGRAGRDGAPARCVLLYADGDAVVQRRLRARDTWPGSEASWEALLAFVHGRECRGLMVARHFGIEGGAPCGACDVCVQPAAVEAGLERLDGHRQRRRAERSRAQAEADAVPLGPEVLDTIVAFVEGLKRPVSRRLVALGLRGSRAKDVQRRALAENPRFGALRALPEDAVLRGVDALLASGRLAPRGKRYPTVWMPDKPVRRAPATPRSSARGAGGDLTRALKDLRKREAKRRRWKAYQVFPDTTLAGIVASRPRDAEALLAVAGMGPVRVERFGEAILRLVAAHAGDHPTSKRTS